MSFSLLQSIEEYNPFEIHILEGIKDKVNQEEEEFNTREKNYYEQNRKELISISYNDKSTKANTNEEKVKKEFFEEELNKMIKKENNTEPNINEKEPQLPFFIKKKCGRKRENSSSKNEHNKFSDDNLRRKCKHILLKNLMIFINKKINDIYGGKIGSGICKKQLQTLNQKQKYDATINFNKQFLYKKIKDIFSENVSGRYTNYPPDHNKNIIERLINEKDEDKKQYFTNLFDLTFIECLQHFTGQKYRSELSGFDYFEKEIEKIKKKYIEDGEDYSESLIYYLKNYESIITNKRTRKSRKK